MTQQLTSRSMAQLAMQRETTTTSAPDLVTPRNLLERRNQLDRMYNMIRSIEDGGAILGTGFFIKSTPEYFEVYRKGYGTQRVTKHITRIATMFTATMFFGGL